MALKYSPWFSDKVKPARKGLYDTRLYKDSAYSGPRLWDGLEWRFHDGKRGTMFGLCGGFWRGLASKDGK